MFTTKLCPQMPHPHVFWREKGWRLLKVLPPFRLLADFVPLRECGCCFLWKEQDCLPRRKKWHPNQHRQLSQFNLVPSASENVCDSVNLRLLLKTRLSCGFFLASELQRAAWKQPWAFSKENSDSEGICPKLSKGNIICLLRFYVNIFSTCLVILETLGIAVLQKVTENDFFPEIIYSIKLRWSVVLSHTTECGLMSLMKVHENTDTSHLIWLFLLPVVWKNTESNRHNPWRFVPLNYPLVLIRKLLSFFFCLLVFEEWWTVLKIALFYRILMLLKNSLS